MKRSICALTLCLALLTGLLTPTALAAGEKPAFSQQPQSTTVTAPDTAVFTAQATGDPTSGRPRTRAAGSIFWVPPGAPTPSAAPPRP